LLAIHIFPSKIFIDIPSTINPVCKASTFMDKKRECHATQSLREADIRKRRAPPETYRMRLECRQIRAALHSTFWLSSLTLSPLLMSSIYRVAQSHAPRSSSISESTKPSRTFLSRSSVSRDMPYAIGEDADEDDVSLRTRGGRRGEFDHFSPSYPIFTIWKASC